jgi:hypothetical protein
VRILGGTGGEAQSNIAKWLPPGVIWRIPKGFAVMLNYHFIDATPSPLLGQGYMDIKLGLPQPTDQVASLYTTINDQFVLNPTPSIQSVDTNCVAQQELEFFAVGNHMHALGYSAYSELIRADGTHQMLRNDSTWTNEQTFNPTITLFPAYNLLQVHVGETLHTHCEWVNTGGTVVTFPTEMCVGFAGFLPGDGNILTCTDGAWGQ